MMAFPSCADNSQAKKSTINENVKLFDKPRNSGPLYILQDLVDSPDGTRVHGGSLLRVESETNSV
jgi:hypothetical protein